jgi:hypothetical protein
LKEAKLTKAELEQLAGTSSNAVSIYCMGSLVANQAARDGFADFAKSLESALTGLLARLPREQQKQALRLAYEMSLDGAAPAPPRLRLAYSRD